MSGERRKFRHEGEEQRRDALINAALELISEGPPGAVTVRAIAARAGVTQGLIRHYFKTKEDLKRAAYQRHMSQMLAIHHGALQTAPDTPLAQLAAFIVASLTPPVIDPKSMSLWAGFITDIRTDPEMQSIHERNYLVFRHQLAALIAKLDENRTDRQIHALSIACNAVLDGLWLEGCALPDAFDQDELTAIGLGSIGAILGVEFTPPVTQPQKIPSIAMKACE